MRAHAQTARAGLTLRTAGDFRPKGDDAAAALSHYRGFERKGGCLLGYNTIVVVNRRYGLKRNSGMLGSISELNVGSLQ